MIKRLFILMSLVGSILLLAWFNPHKIEPAEFSRYIKIGSDGNIISSWGGPWNCVCDQQTGLLWETKTDDESIHDGYWSYSWFDEHTGVENSGDCYFESDRCDTNDLIRRMNQEKTCSETGWRLPTHDELSTLIFKDSKPGQPKIDKTVFPHTQRGGYWTSSSAQPLSGVFKYLKEGATSINFIEGTKVTLPYRNALFVRLIKEGSHSCKLNDI
jgi:hypothetical protein